MTTALPGFEDNPRYISELGIKTERDGSLSLSETDFQKLLPESQYFLMLWLTL